MAHRIPAASGLYNYTKLAQNSTNYAKRMKRLRNGIFGELVKEHSVNAVNASARFTRKPFDIDPEIINYYPRHVETGLLIKNLREYGLFRDQHADFQEQMHEARRLRGKVKERKKRN